MQNLEKKKEYLEEMCYWLRIAELEMRVFSSTDDQIFYNYALDFYGRAMNYKNKMQEL